MENRQVTILLVEDDLSMLEGMRDLLRLASLQAEDTTYDVSVMTAENGVEALKKMEDVTPDLIISDIMMPQMTGYEFLQTVRKRSEWLQIPFIFLTAKGERRSYDEGKLKGADLYITKPFTPETFLKHVTTQLHRSFKRQAIQQQHVAALKKHILQILNHEFRTPLTYVTAYYEMLADGVKSDGAGMDYREYLRGIQAGCVRLARLVDDFLRVMTLKSGEAAATFDEEARPVTNMRRLVQEAIENRTAAAREENVRLHNEVPESFPAVLGVADDLRNIFERLLDNAIKFSNNEPDEVGQVYVTGRASEDEICVSVVDEGSGFPDHLKSQIFELFYQHAREVKEQQGAGMGLTIVQELVTLHGGRIDVSSEEGEGSIFTVVLPSLTETAVDQWHPDQARARRRKKATVLAVEDDRHLLTGLEDLLQTSDDYDLTVLTAANGKAALEVLEQHDPNLIISDIMMPQMSGYEFLEKVRSNPEWLQIPVIFLTAKGEPADKHKAFIIGVDEYITKPYDSDVLLKFVSSQLDRRFRVQRMLAESYDSLKQTILNLVTPNFRQPLTFVSEYTAKLAGDLEDAETEEELKVSLRGIQIGSEWLKRLIEDFMSLAEITTGEAETAYRLQSQPIHNLEVFLSEFATLQSQKLADDGVEIRFRSEESLPGPIFGSLSYLTDVVRRLIEIGLQYCVEETSSRVVEISLAPHDAHVQLTIRFSTAFTEDVFKSISRILRTEEDVLLSSLSLAPSLNIAKGYVTLHEGALSVTNDPGDNASFHITLPTAPEPAVA